ncbi:hypothetical protein [Amycolatopsis sp. WGS_07]|uniref:hypothetical protein n=1 Tax=Amycolatopsis sp. WGS_07 TaxID=3076764 RepID=UPI003873ADA4
MDVGVAELTEESDRFGQQDPAGDGERGQAGEAVTGGQEAGELAGVEGEHAQGWQVSELVDRGDV